MAQYLEMNPNILFLVVDNVESNAEAMMYYMKKMGYRNFIRAETGYDAINIIKEKQVDYILSRVDLPVMSGLELFLELKSDFNFQRKPFILFSEDISKEDHILFQEVGVDAHMSLPFDTKDLSAKINSTWAKYIDKNNVEFYFEKFRILYLSGNYNEAFKILDFIEKSGQLKQRVVVARAQLYRKTEKLDDALKLAKAASVNFAKYVHAHQLLGECLLEAKRPVDAIKSFHKAISLSPANPYRYEVVGKVLLDLQLWDEAYELFQGAVKKGLDYTPIIAGKGKAQVGKGDFKKAIVEFKTALERKQTGVQIYNNLAICYKKLGEFPRALFYYKKSLEVEPENLAVHYNIGLLQEKKGEKVEAIKCFQKVYNINPEFKNSAQKLKNLGVEGIVVPQKKNPAQGNQAAQPFVKQSLTEDGRENLKQTLQAVNKKPDKEREHTAIVSKLRSANSKQVFKYYLSQYAKVRKQYAHVMQSFFQKFSKTTEDIVCDMIEMLSELNSKMEELGTKEAQICKFTANSLGELINHSHFQDYISQNLMVTVKVFKEVNTELNAEKWYDKTVSLFVDEEMKTFFKESLKKETSKNYLEHFSRLDDFILSMHYKLLNKFSHASSTLLNLSQKIVLYMYQQKEVAAPMLNELEDFSKKESAMQELSEKLSLIKDRNSYFEKYANAVLGITQYLIQVEKRFKSSISAFQLVKDTNVVHYDLERIIHIYSLHGDKLDIWSEISAFFNQFEYEELIKNALLQQDEQIKVA